MKKFTFLNTIIVILFLFGIQSITAQVTVTGTTVTEGDAGTSNATLNVTHTCYAPAGGVTVLYALIDNTATVGSDYNSGGDRIIIAQGASSGTISVPISAIPLSNLQKTLQ